MTFANAWGIDGLAFDGADMRHVIAALADDASGCLGSADLAVSQTGTPGGNVQVAAGQIIITATGGTIESWLATNEGAVTVAVPPTSANGRKDRLLVQVIAGIPTLVLVAGTPSGSPAEPSIAGYSDALELAMINIPASTSTITNAMITDRRAQATPPWRTPWGEVARSSGGSFAFNTGAGASPSLSVPVVAGRKYRITVTAEIQNSTVTGVVDTLSVYVSGGAAIITPIIRHTPASSSNQVQFSGVGRYVGVATGAQTWEVQAIASASATVQTCIVREFLVEDIGPA